MCLNCFGDTAWRKHFSKAAPFLHEILHQIIFHLYPIRLTVKIIFYNLNSAKNYNEANDFRLNLP